MKQPFATPRPGRRVFIFAIIFVALLALVAGALPARRGRAAGQDQQGRLFSSSGTRSSSLRPKTKTKGIPRSSPQNRAPASIQYPNREGGAAASVLLANPDLPRRVLATADFDLVGLAVTASPATQTVPKNTATAVLTSVESPPGVDPSEIIASLNPDYRVRGELTGPSLTTPLTVEAPIGQPLPIPPLSRAGDHALQNLRVVDTGAEGTPVIASVTPDTAGIVVIDQILISEVRVEELSYDEIIQAGINITDDSYKFFNFVMAVTTSSQAVQFNIPVAFPDPKIEDPRPVVGRPNAPFSVGTAIPEFDVIPVMLTMEEEDEGGGNALKFEGNEVRIPGVVVFPGRIGLLNQFFEAIVIVSNGAPGGTPLIVRNLRAKVNLPDNGTPTDPSDDPLRIAETQTGGMVTELEIHGLGPDGEYGTADDKTSFSPGESGQASFLLEGLREGLHSPVFELEGTLEGLPIGPVTVRGEVPGTVLVRDASFAVTFSHPSVVRAGNEYELSMTVYNSGSRDLQGLIVQLNPNSISGATLTGNDTGERAFATTIKRKESSTVVWRLRAQVTGAVSASYVKVGEDVEAGITLTTGVGDRNIPLSPDSLILPDEVRFLPPEVVEAGRALLGQAWSIATAPRGSLPQGVTPVLRDTVAKKAAEMGVAGLRVEFGEPVEVSLQTLMRDWLGELQSLPGGPGTPDAGFADAMRDTVSGFEWHDAIGRYLYTHLASGATATSLHQGLAAAESPRSSFVSALVTQADGAALFGARFIDPLGRKVGFMGSATERFGEDGDGASLLL
ncbi:MAG: hypothetical protein L0229_24180, partial [Blastocatellia bacterium]|nr:hypothetical protein [Blastocatellia bacterium]